MAGTLIGKLVFALVATLAVMSASWGLQRLRFFRQAAPFNRVTMVALSIFAVLFLLQLLWP